MQGKKSQVWFSVLCRKHGIVNTAKHDAAPFVTVSEPLTKKQRNESGCPLCKIENQRLLKEIEKKLE